jgi:hypothetical protein
VSSAGKNAYLTGMDEDLPPVFAARLGADGITWLLENPSPEPDRRNRPPVRRRIEIGRRPRAPIRPDAAGSVGWMRIHRTSSALK